MENSIVVVSPRYNGVDYVEQNALSVLTQKYDNFKVILIDDFSNDGTYEKILNFFNADINDFTLKTSADGSNIHVHKLQFENSNATSIELWRRTKRSYALLNWHDAAMIGCEKNDILVSLDGDDWLLNRTVLQHVNDSYNQTGCWIMYGGCSWTDGRKCCSMEYAPEEFKNIRKAHFKVSMMRTYRAGLYQKIQEFDKTFSCMKDKNGNWYKMACDVAIMFPLLEMAGHDKVIHNKKPIYIYNRDNPINDDKVYQQLQWDIHAEITNKKSFSKISSI